MSERRAVCISAWDSISCFYGACVCLVTRDRSPRMSRAFNFTVMALKKIYFLIIDNGKNIVR